RVQYLGQLAPATLDLGQAGHIGHRAASGQVRQDGDLIVRRHDVGHFRHEVHAAENDVLSASLTGKARQLERVTGQVGVLIDVSALIVVTQQYRATTQLGPRGAYARMRVLIGEGVETVEIDGGGLHAGYSR